VVLINGDAAIFFPLALLLASAVLVMIFRNVHGVALTLAVTVSAVVWALLVTALRIGARASNAPRATALPGGQASWVRFAR
jgi:hypothetical protein